MGRDARARLFLPGGGLGESRRCKTDGQSDGAASFDEGASTDLPGILAAADTDGGRDGGWLRWGDEFHGDHLMRGTSKTRCHERKAAVIRSGQDSRRAADLMAARMRA